MKKQVKIFLIMYLVSVLFIIGGSVMKIFTSNISSVVLLLGIILSVIATIGLILKFFQWYNSNE